MRRRHSLSITSVCALILSAACGAQNTNSVPSNHPIDTRPEGQQQTCTYSASRSNGTTTGGSACPQSGTTASPAKRFPYSGDTASDLSIPAANPAATKTPGTDTPATNQSGTPSAAKRFPFPGESGVPAQNSPLKDAGSSGESTSSSSSSSSSSADDLPENDPTPGGDALPAPKRARKKLPPVARQTPDEREEEDVRIAAFYQNDGNYRAAYMRAKDAVSITETDPDAQFALAEAARKLGKFDEAQKGYRRCLELDPIPKLRKASEKALKEMSGS